MHSGLSCGLGLLFWSLRSIGAGMCESPSWDPRSLLAGRHSLSYPHCPPPLRQLGIGGGFCAAARTHQAAYVNMCAYLCSYTWNVHICKNIYKQESVYT